MEKGSHLFTKGVNLWYLTKYRKGLLYFNYTFHCFENGIKSVVLVNEIQYFCL